MVSRAKKKTFLDPFRGRRCQAALGHVREGIYCSMQAAELDHPTHHRRARLLACGFVPCSILYSSPKRRRRF